jgi:hypothetical protein
MQLVLAATARGDTLEVARLRYSCPAEQRGEFTELLVRTRRLAVAALFMWVHISHGVVRSRLEIIILHYHVLASEEFMRDASPADKKKLKIDKKKLKILVREIRAALVDGVVQYKEQGALWKGLEAAITRFCTERGLTPQQLFVGGMPSVIDEARVLLADVPAYPETEDAVYEQLFLSGQNARGKG